jgi:hypothetical protein
LSQLTSRQNVHSAKPEGRPIILNLWYPTNPSSTQEPMKHSEYLNFSSDVLSDVLSDDLEKKFYDYNLKMISTYSFDSDLRTPKRKRKKLTKKTLANNSHAH